jgi:hypothetical protein
MRPLCFRQQPVAGRRDVFDMDLIEKFSGNVMSIRSEDLGAAGSDINVVVCTGPLEPGL